MKDISHSSGYLPFTSGRYGSLFCARGTSQYFRWLLVLLCALTCVLATNNDLISPSTETVPAEATLQDGNSGPNIEFGAQQDDYLSMYGGETYMDYADVPSGNPMSCKSAPLKSSYVTVIAMEGTLDGALEVYEDLHDSKEPSSFLELNVQKKRKSGSRSMQRDTLSDVEDEGTRSTSNISMIPGPAKRQGDTLSFSTKKPVCYLCTQFVPHSVAV